MNKQHKNKSVKQLKDIVVYGARAMQRFDINDHHNWDTLENVAQQVNDAASELTERGAKTRERLQEQVDTANDIREHVRGLRIENEYNENKS